MACTEAGDWCSALPRNSAPRTAGCVARLVLPGRQRKQEARKGNIQPSLSRLTSTPQLPRQELGRPGRSKQPCQDSSSLSLCCPAQATNNCQGTSQAHACRMHVRHVQGSNRQAQLVWRVAVCTCCPHPLPRTGARHQQALAARAGRQGRAAWLGSTLSVPSEERLPIAGK